MSVSTKEVDRASSNVLETSAESEQANYWLDLISTNSTETSGSFRDAKWVLPGEHIEIAGFDINCGMIYVGRHLPDDHHMSEDPCLINPTLKVNRVCFNRTGKCKGPGTSYQKMSATRKSAYLEWLSDGRCSAKAYTGFVFQFLYGLEYRVLRELKEGRSNDGVVSELTQIREEVARLQSIYGDASTSFKEYASRFLDICDLLRKSDSVYKAEPSLSENLWGTEPCWHFRLRLKVTLAQIAKEKQPVPIDWLFAWWFNAKRAEQSYLYNTEKFRGLIRQKYEEKYGEGIVIELGTDPLRVSYRTANSGFSHSEACLTIEGLTDVSFSEQTFHAIQVLVDECTLETETYLKKERYYKGSNKEASIEKVKEDIPGLQQWLRKMVGRKHCANVSVRVLLEKCSMPNFQLISNYRLVEVCQALETLGYGIEPDILSKRKELKEDIAVPE
ncbi:MAG: TerB N-terminal domain-containing protein [Cyanobacteria bacterium P01_D01_bin.1]